jgi:predicted RNase H-like nuclease
LNQDLKEHQENLEQATVQINSLEKRLKDKEKKSQQLDEKVIDLQEQNMAQINKAQAEANTQKSLTDHQINELKKRIDEIDALSQTYKNQLTQQKQLEA